MAGYDIAYMSKIHNIQHYEKDDKRHGVIIDIQENKFGNRTKVLIELRQGQPIVNQVYDALYDVGKDCDIKSMFLRMATMNMIKVFPLLMNI